MNSTTKKNVIKILDCIIHADYSDTLSELRVDIPSGEYPRTWLRDAAMMVKVDLEEKPIAAENDAATES